MTRFVEDPGMVEKPWWQKPEFLVPILAAIIAGVFGLWSGVFADGDASTPPITTIVKAATSTETQDLIAIAQATRNAELTLTAVREFILAQEQTAAATLWTDTPTTRTPARTPTNTPRPTSTWAPTWTSAPTNAPCSYMSAPFATTATQVQDRIGCPQAISISGLIAEENFQGGIMFWREPIDYAQALVLFNNGTWQIYQHAPYVEGNEYSCTDANTPAQTPPTPRRGFGAMWCDIPAIRSGLGNATDDERGYTSYMQQFDHGFMIRTDYNATFVFYDSGTWERK